MCDEIQKAAVPRPRPDRPNHQRTEDDDQHDAQVGRKGQGECVVETQALEGMSAEEAVNEFADTTGESELIAGHGDGQSGSDPGGDRTEPKALPAEHPARSSRDPAKPARAISGRGQGAQRRAP